MKKHMISLSVLAVTAVFTLSACGSTPQVSQSEPMVPVTETSQSVGSHTPSSPEVSQGEDHSASWPSEGRAEFIDICQSKEGNSKELCTCTIDAIQKHYDFPTFQEMTSQKGDKEKAVKLEVSKILIKECGTSMIKDVPSSPEVSAPAGQGN